jgi:hypothetical protein
MQKYIPSVVHFCHNVIKINKTKAVIQKFTGLDVRTKKAKGKTLKGALKG